MWQFLLLSSIFSDLTELGTVKSYYCLLTNQNWQIRLQVSATILEALVLVC